MAGIGEPATGGSRLRRRRGTGVAADAAAAVGAAGAASGAVPLGSLLELLQDGVGIIDPDGTVAEVNRRFLEIVGLDRDQVIGATPPYPWWPPERSPALGEEIDTQLVDGCAHYELELVRGDGERFPAVVDVATLNDRLGRAGFLAVLRDETAAAAERRRRRDAERAAGLATWEWNPATDEMHGSTGLLDRAGVGRDDRRTLAGVLSYVHGEAAEHLRRKMEEVAEGKRAEFALEVPVDVPKSDIGWLEVRGRPVVDEADRVTRVRGVTQDITKRRRADAELNRSRELLSAAERLADVGSFESDDRTGEAAWSDNLHRLFGLEEEGPSHRLVDHQNIVAAADRERFLETRAEVIADGVPRMVEHRYSRGDELRWAETRLEPLREDGEIVGIRGTLQDITERRHTEEEARLHAHLLDAVETAVVTVGLDGVITHWNAGAEALYGWSDDEAIGQPVTMLAADQAERSRAREMIRSIEPRRGGKWRGEFKIRRKDGSTFTALVQSSFFTDEHGEPAGIVGTAVDLSDRVDHEERVRSARDYLLAVTDSIGEGVYTLDEKGRLMYANPATERILGWSAEELRGKVMHNVIHFRRPDGSYYPPEECPGTGALTERKTVRVEDEMFITKDGREIEIEYTASPVETGGARGTVVVFSDISERRRREREVDHQIEALSWVERIRDALDQDRFEIFAQPIVDLASGEVTQHELLIRMRGADGELIAPGRFLGVAEEFSVIGEIDHWMIGQAAALAEAGHAVHVNLSAQSVGRSEVTDALVGALRRTGADPGLIVIELTETALLEHEAEAEAFTQRLRHIGCGLALDDFGTGYGGFSYLKRLSVDYLKIDREFVSDLTENEASRHVVTAVISLAKGFGQKTVAEGVEDQATLELLRELGVDYAQGFHIARPVPVAEALSLG